ncbi:MAG: uracil-DNA glycosylase [Clostridia bacterium]|nr:uracil-DNA glycosylase [Clostridia bacterium]
MNRELQHVNEDCARMVASRWPHLAGHIVYGTGCEANPLMMLVGEAPGKKEEVLGKPFVGSAGRQLDFFIKNVGVPRETLYISNTVKIRPTRLSVSGNHINRTPSADEIDAFIPYLNREIAAVCPRMLVTLGGVALKALLREDKTIGTGHGHLYKAQISPILCLPLFALYHPAAVIYKRSLMAAYLADLDKLAMEVKDL